jgi:hypothetical protein
MIALSGACQCQNADPYAFTQQRNAEDGAIATQFRRLRPSVFRVGQHIGNVNDLAFEQGPAPDFGLDREGHDIFHELGGKPYVSARMNTPPICRAIVALSASQSRAADSTSVCSTALRSKVERLMTLSTSAVAVCWSDCRSSFSSRAFSMAMTAWLAKLL